MAKTKTEIATLALQAIRAVEGDATPDANDLSTMEDAYDEVYAMLATKHLVSWSPTGSVPDAVVVPVMALTASYRLPLFKVPIEALQMVAGAASTAIGDITEALALDYVYEPIASEPL